MRYRGNAASQPLGRDQCLARVNLPRRTKGLRLENVTPFPDGPRRAEVFSRTAAILSGYGVTYPVLTSGPACPHLTQIDRWVA
jgi:hypothetical protein